MESSSNETKNQERYISNQDTMETFMASVYGMKLCKFHDFFVVYSEYKMLVAFKVSYSLTSEWR